MTTPEPYTFTDADGITFEVDPCEESDHAAILWTVRKTTGARMGVWLTGKQARDLSAYLLTLPEPRFEPPPEPESPQSVDAAIARDDERSMWQELEIR